MELKHGSLRRWNSMDVRVLEVAPDPDAPVRIVELADPDRVHMVPRDELQDFDVDDDLHCDHADGLCRGLVGLPCDEKE